MESFFSLPNQETTKLTKFSLIWKKSRQLLLKNKNTFMGFLRKLGHAISKKSASHIHSLSRWRKADRAAPARGTGGTCC